MYIWHQDEVIQSAHLSWFGSGSKEVYAQARNSVIGRRWLRLNWLKSVAPVLSGLVPNALISFTEKDKWLSWDAGRFESEALMLGAMIHQTEIRSCILRKQVIGIKSALGENLYRAIIESDFTFDVPLRVDALDLNRQPNELHQELMSLGMTEIIATARNIHMGFAERFRLLLEKQLVSCDSCKPYLSISQRLAYFRNREIANG